jgi:hypothetical protein
MVQITWKSLMTGTSGEGEDQIEMVQEEWSKDDPTDGAKNGPSDFVIPRRKDRGKWPPLYDECKIMLASSVLAYAIANLRNQIRRGKITDPSITEPFMQLPFYTEELRPIVYKNKHLFNRILGGESNDMVDDDRNQYAYLETILDMRKLQMEGDEFLPRARVLLELHDEKNEKEMVYTIGLNQ